MSVLGIDEAGRGPVIGPMVMAGVFVQNHQESRWLELLGVNDSKKIVPKKREELAVSLQKLRHAFVVIEPGAIDSCNINELEIKGVSELASQFLPQTLIWDAPVAPPGLGRLALRVRRLLPEPIPHLILENKADAKYPSCMAASILAKVERDRRIVLLRERFGDFGSGYPSDPKTAEFLRRFYEIFLRTGFGEHVRKKWGTMKRLQMAGS